MSDDGKLVQRLLKQVEALKADVEALKCRQGELANSGGCNNNPVDKNPSDRDILSLNVGGIHFDVLRGTLTAMPGLLATRFSGEWDANLLRDSKGRFYLEEDPELFGELIKYLREYSRMVSLEFGGDIGSPRFGDVDKEQRLHRMIESFHMTSSVYPMELWKYGPQCQDVCAPIAGDIFDIPQVDQTNGAFHYALRAKGSHRRRIKAFEVQIKPKDTCDVLNVGWTDWECHDADYYTEPSTMVASCRALDVLKSVVMIHKYHDGSKSHIRVTLPASKCFHVRCAGFGAEWYVNDELLDLAVSKSEGKALVDKMRPFIAMRGASSFQVTKLELEL